MHTSIKALRRALEPDRRRDEFEVLKTAANGYELILADEHLDAYRFEKAVADGRAEAHTDPESARTGLRRALTTWRGDAYHEARDHDFAAEEIRRLEAIRDAAKEDLFECEIACGNAASTIVEIANYYAAPHNFGREPRLELRAYEAIGELTKAAAVYENFCVEHEQEPSDEFTKLYSALLERQPAGRPPTNFSEATTRSAVEGYRERIREQLRHSDIRWVVGAPKSGVTLSAADLFTPLYVDAGPSQVVGHVGALSLEELVARSDRLVLVGASGCGKSTFLEHLARVSAATVDGPIPLLVRCRDLVGGAWAREARPDWRSLQAEVKGELAHEASGLNVEDFERLAQTGKVIWLVDALNEIPDDKDRVKLANMLASAAQHWSSCKWVATTSISTTAESLPLGFDVAEVAKWDPDHMLAFLRSLVRLSPETLSEESVDKRAGAILDRVLDHPDPVMRRLAGSPLFLTAMAVLDLAGRPPAESRADLLESITSWLVEDRMTLLQQSLGSTLRVDEVLRTLAYTMVSGNTGVAVQMGRLAAAQALEHLFPERNRGAALDFVTQASRVGGLLVPRGVGDVGFSQDLFRDYLAAKHLAGKTDGAGTDGWWSVLEQRLDDPAWRDVLSFVPARLLHLGRERVDLFFERFGEASRSTPFETRTQRVALGGQILRDLRPLGYTSASHIPAWHDAVTGVRRMFEVPSDQPALEIRVEAAAAFGREGDPRLDDPETAWSWLPGASCKLGAQATDPTATGFDRDAAPWEGPVRDVSLAPFAIRRFPITVVEYQDFVEDGGYHSLASVWPSEGWSWRASSNIRGPLAWEDQLAVPNAPVTGVSWFEAMAFVAWASERELSDDLCWRLPSEEQWEFAARRGVPTSQQFPWGDRMTWGPAAEANWAGCFLRRKSPVGMFPQSTTRDGVADLFGNVEEWCSDSWNSVVGPEWRSNSTSGDGRRVVRGGSTIRFSRLCRPSYRSAILAGHRYHTVGFRPVLERVPQ